MMPELGGNWATAKVKDLVQTPEFCAYVIGPGAANSPYAGKLTDCLKAPDHFVHDLTWTPEPGREQWASYRHAYLGSRDAERRRRLKRMAT